jgi:Sec-independent protein translocase protein TatA
MFLDPAKLLVILIVGLVVLGPDKLPVVAKQLGAAWGEIRRFRERIESEVRGTFPDLPSTHEVAQAVRSPLAFLDQLADAHEKEQKELQAPEVAKDGQLKVTQPGGTTAVEQPPESDAGIDLTSAEATTAQVRRSEVENPAPASEPENGARPRSVGRTRPWGGSQPVEPVSVPDDPSMN